MQEFTDISKVYFIFIGTITVIIIISMPDGWSGIDVLYIERLVIWFIC